MSEIEISYAIELAELANDSAMSELATFGMIAPFVDTYDEWAGHDNRAWSAFVCGLDEDGEIIAEELV